MQRSLVYPWQRAPALRPLAALVAGILLQGYWPMDGASILAGSGLCMALLLAYGSLPVHLRYRWRAVGGLLLSATLLLGGAALGNANDSRAGPDPPPAPILVIEEPPVEKRAGFRATASVDGMACRLLLYFPRAGGPPVLQAGDRLLALKTPQRLRPKGNPGSFDFAAWCLQQGITHQVQLLPADYRVLNRPAPRPWQRLVGRCREAVLQQLKRYIPAKKERGLAEALLIGDKAELDEDLQRAYTNTGVVHVIAISGLHLGLIYSLLLGITRPLGRGGKGRLVRFLLLMAGLWLFSFMAGAQPSVMRSAVMFTFLALAENLARRTNTINSLALSALVLLCIDPAWLQDAGFLLSYSALLGILFFSAPIYRRLAFPNRLLDAVWKLCAVTLAAQILTLPVSIYLFHQVPLLFLLTNLVAVPLSSLILLVEIALCLSGGWNALATLLGKATTVLIALLNAYIGRLENVSFALLTDVYLDLPGTLLLTALLLCGCFALLHGERKLVMPALLFLLCLAALQGLRYCRVQGQQRLVVFHTPRGVLAALYAGERAAVFRQDISDSNGSRLLLPAAPVFGTKRSRHLKSNLVVLNGRAALFWDGDSLPLTGGRSIHWLILFGRPRLPPAELLGYQRPVQVIIAASVPEASAQEWVRACRLRGVAVHSISALGAWVE